jgi:hypothetical protein
MIPAVDPAFVHTLHVNNKRPTAIRSSPNDDHTGKDDQSQKRGGEVAVLVACTVDRWNAAVLGVPIGLLDV